MLLIMFLATPPKTKKCTSTYNLSRGSNRKCHTAFSTYHGVRRGGSVFQCSRQLQEASPLTQTFFSAREPIVRYDRLYWPLRVEGLKAGDLSPQARLRLEDVLLVHRRHVQSVDVVNVLLRHTPNVISKRINLLLSYISDN